MQLPQQAIYTFEQGDAADLLRHQRSDMVSNHGHFPGRDTQMLKHAAGAIASQSFELAFLDSFKLIPVGNLIRNTHEPGKRIGQGAIEVEYNHPILHKIMIPKK